MKNEHRESGFATKKDAQEFPRLENLRELRGQITGDHAAGLMTSVDAELLVHLDRMIVTMAEEEQDEEERERDIWKLIQLARYRDAEIEEGGNVALQTKTPNFVVPERHTLQ